MRDFAVPPWLMTILAILSVQLSSTLSVSVIDRVGAAGTAWLRMLCGAAILWVIARPRLRSLTRADLPQLFILGTATGFMTMLFLGAIHRIPLGTAVAIEFLGPLTVAAATSGNKKRLMLPVLALAGVVLLTQPWRGHIDPLGLALALGAGTGWGLYTFYTQRVGDRFSGISGLTLTVSIAALATAPVGLPQVLRGEFSLPLLGLAAFIALIAPVVAFALEMNALRRMTHTAFGTLLSLEPAFAMLFGMVLLHQSPGTWQLVGIVLVVVAGALAQRGGSRSAAQA